MTTHFPFTIEKHRALAVGHDDPLLTVTFDTDDGGRESFLVEVKRDFHGNLLPDRYCARTAYGDRGVADNAGTAVLRLLKAWNAKCTLHGSPHEASVAAALDAMLMDLTVVYAVRHGMSVR